MVGPAEHYSIARLFKTSNCFIPLIPQNGMPLLVEIATNASGSRNYKFGVTRDFVKA
ncbi:MAG: hypothetical protein CM1200mP16_12100 [Nitrospina sp.]|nr:MAG: hypothetical protein CM1200mP16_12100 [Nitrospina sp.]